MNARHSGKLIFIPPSKENDIPVAIINETLNLITDFTHAITTYNIAYKVRVLSCWQTENLIRHNATIYSVLETGITCMHNVVEDHSQLTRGCISTEI